MKNPFRKTIVERVVEVVKAKAKSIFSQDLDPPLPPLRNGQRLLEANVQYAKALAPIAHVQNAGMDSSDGQSTIKRAYTANSVVMSDAILGWFLSQGFIGYQVASFVAQHWLVEKCCAMPGADAIRQGYTIVSDEGEDLNAKVLQAMVRADEKFKINAHMKQFVHMGRVFGIRIALFKVTSTDPDYYLHPFNPDGITPGSYKGIVQIDPYWCAPELDTAAAADPASPHFYEPTWWRINGKRYHRSHLIIFRNGEVSDLLKPAYMYGGVPVPQRILERVYAAERTANEAPQLAMTKRTTLFGTDAATAWANKEAFDERLREWVELRDNYAVKVHDKDADEITQMDTSLTDLDSVIMTQYQIVAAAAGVPATKLLGTSPKGFNATGEFEMKSYHEELESIQTHDLTPLLERHHLLVMRSIVAPKLLDGVPIETSAVWAPLDSPGAKEEAEINKAKTDSDKTLLDAGAIDGLDIRKRIAADRNSGYFGIEMPAEPIDALEVLAGMAQPGAVAGDSMDGVRLVSNQRFIDPKIVAEKIAAGDYAVQVSPLFIDPDGNRYRIVIDGHHSLAAAKQAGVPPELVEGDYSSSDYAVIADA